MKCFYCYEIFFSKPDITQDEWGEYIQTLNKFFRVFSKWKIIIKIENNKIRYILKTREKTPISLNNKLFLIKEIEDIEELKVINRGYYINSITSNIVDVINEFKKKDKYIKEIYITFKDIYKWNFDKIKVVYEYKNKYYKKRLLFSFPRIFLKIDFKSNKSFVYNKVPKYLKIDKILHLLTNNSNDTILNVDTFPYLDNNFYLRHDSYDFYKHSLVIGSSGTGKSKFLSLLISNIAKYNKNNYKIVVIDPHDALKNELEGMVIDFKSWDSSVDLFKNSIDDINVLVELTLSLFKNLINDGYNSKLERVLRFSVYLLYTKNCFSFINLKKLLLELEYRNSLVNELKMVVPSSVVNFFLTDFNELKNNSYNEAISPIIAFIDEMNLIPVFNESRVGANLEEVIRNNFLSVFSLNRLKLGDKVTKTIAGFLMQQIFLLVEEYFLDKHLILIIDEVAILENPILARFLSEARKYNASVILSGQYFSQVSSELQEAILANTNNYYLFRVSKKDALIFENNLDIKLEVEDSLQNRTKLLTDLSVRECLVRISGNGTLYPVFKARTMDYNPPPKENGLREVEVKKVQELTKFTFDFKSDVSVEDIMKKNSSSRKKV